MGIKTDCFAYKKNLNRCGALEVLYCKDGECRFYKTKEERCEGCKKVKGRTLTCTECVKKGLK